jgi:hypothetical protein
LKVLKQLRTSWNCFWFKPIHPADLCAPRFVFFAAVFLFYFLEDFGAWASMPSELWHPISFFQFFRQPSAGWVIFLSQVWKTSLLLSAIGFLTPVFLPIAASLGLYMIGLQFCFGFIHEANANIALYSLVLACSPCGERLSVDSLIRKKYPGWCGRAKSEILAWPIKLIWVIWCCMFISAAFSKLQHTGVAWVTGDGLRDKFVLNQYHFSFRHFDFVGSLAFWIARFPRLCNFLAGLVLALELSVWLILFSRRLRIFLVPCFFLIQIVMWLVFLADFRISLLAYVFFVPWGAWMARIFMSVGSWRGSLK